MIIVTIWYRVRSRNLDDDGKVRATRVARKKAGRGAGRNGLRREIHPRLPKNVGAINSCRSPAVSLAGSTCCRTRRGHRAKPVLNALLNFTNLRRAVNHLGGSSGLGCCSCRIWPGEVPAEFLRWDLPARIHRTYCPSYRRLRTTLILISRFDLFPSRSTILLLLFLASVFPITSFFLVYLAFPCRRTPRSSLPRLAFKMSWLGEINERVTSRSPPRECQLARLGPRPDHRSSSGLMLWPRC